MTCSAEPECSAGHATHACCTGGCCCHQAGLSGCVWSERGQALTRSLRGGRPRLAARAAGAARSGTAITGGAMAATAAGAAAAASATASAAALDDAPAMSRAASLLVRLRLPTVRFRLRM